MYKFDYRYAKEEKIQFEGQIIALLNENGLRTAVIKVLNGPRYYGFSKGEIKVLKFRTWPYKNKLNKLEEYETHFIDQLIEHYDFGKNPDNLLGKKFNFTYIGTQIEGFANLHQYDFSSVEPIEDTPNKDSESSGACQFIEYDCNIEEVFATKTGTGLLLKKIVSEDDVVDEDSLYKFHWVSKENQHLVDGLPIIFEYLDGSEEYGGMEELKSRTVAVREVKSMTVVNRDENMRKLTELSDHLYSLEFYL